MAEPGDMASAARTVYQISIMDPKWVRAYVSETQLKYVQEGAEALVTTDTTEPLKARVGHISSEAEFTPKKMCIRDSSEHVFTSAGNFDTELSDDDAALRDEVTESFLRRELDACTSADERRLLMQGDDWAEKLRTLAGLPEDLAKRVIPDDVEPLPREWLERFIGTCLLYTSSSQYSGTASQAAAASPSLSSESGGTASKREFVSLVILLVILRRFSHGLEGLVHLFFKSGHQFFVLCLLEQLLLEKLEAHLAPFVRNPAHPV